MQLIPELSAFQAAFHTSTTFLTRISGRIPHGIAFLGGNAEFGFATPPKPYDINVKWVLVRQRGAVGSFALHVVVTDTKAYAFRMSRKAKSLNTLHEGHMKLIALLLYVAEQKQKSADTVEQLFRRLMSPRKN